MVSVQTKTVSCWCFRVSFGSKGSMVETWIIEDLPAARSSKEEEFITSLVTHSKSDPG